MTTHDREQRLRELFERLLPLPKPEREALLATIGDEVLSERARALLSQDARGTAPLLHDSPALAMRKLRRIDKFELLRELGRGGMGTVMLARQVEPVERLVALKMISNESDSEAVVARFEQECQTLALMKHPGIARMYEGGTAEDGTLWFAMEFVRGESITAYCDRRHLACDQRIGLFMEVCDAIQHAHQKAVLHRDLKPDNVLVSEESGSPLPKVIDFGVARALSRAPGQRLQPDESASVVGTWLYMSPEQADPAGQDIDTRSDIYSLGVMLYELLTGGLPLMHPEGDHRFESFRPILLQKVPPTASERLRALPPQLRLRSVERRGTTESALIRHLRGDLDDILRRVLAKDRNDRYASASELRADLERYLRAEPVTAAAPTARYRLGHFVRRHRVSVIAGVLVALGLSGGMAGATYAMFAARRAHVAETEAHAKDRQQLMRTAAVADFFDLVLLQAAPGTGAAQERLSDVLDRASLTIEPRYHRERTEEAAVHTAVGRVYLGIGKPKQALEHLSRAWRLESADQLGDPGRMFLLLGDLARATRRVDGQEASRVYYAQMLELGVRILDRAEPDLARSLRELVDLAHEPNGMPTFLRRLDAVLVSLLKVPATDTAARLANPMLAALGILLQEESLDAGAAVLSRLETSLRQTLGDDMHLLLVLGRFASYLLSRGAYGEAHRVAVDVLDRLDRSAFGDHWLRLQAQRIRGLALALSSEPAAGETALVALAARWSEARADQHEEVQAAAHCLSELCQLLAAEGRLDSFLRGSFDRWCAEVRREASCGPWWPASTTDLPPAARTATLALLESLPATASGPHVRAARGAVLLQMDRAGTALEELLAARAGMTSPTPELLADLVTALTAAGRIAEADTILASLMAMAATQAVPEERLARAQQRARVARGR